MMLPFTAFCLTESFCREFAVARAGITSLYSRLNGRFSFNGKCKLIRVNFSCYPHLKLMASHHCVVPKIVVFISLYEVRHRPFDGIANQQNELDRAVHIMNTLWNRRRVEVGRCLLDGQLVRSRVRHDAPVPVQALSVVV